GPASSPAPALVVEDENSVLASINDLDWLQDVVVPNAPVVAKVIDRGILAADQPRVVGEQPDCRGVNLDFVVEQVEEPARIPSSVHAAYDLDVLLRHRPRSISRWTCAFHAKQHLLTAITEVPAVVPN